MNLLTKTTILYIFLSLIVLSIGGVIALQLIREEVRKETDYSLIENFLELRESLDNGIPANSLCNNKVQIHPVPSTGAKLDTSIQFQDTVALHHLLNRPEPHRVLHTIKPVDGTYYDFRLIDVFIEPDDSYEVVVKIMTRLFLILGAVFIVCSLLISRSLLRPFYRSLDILRRFNVKNDQQMDFPRTSTKEFQQLNNLIGQMMHKTRRDYRSLKEFTENASHEIQTPLAIAQGKLELLLESASLLPEQIQLIHGSQDALRRLSKMGEALLLLTKIENEATVVRGKTDLTALTERMVKEFGAIAELKGLALHTDIARGVTLPIDTGMAELLLNNLFKNAVRHNLSGGWIQVRLTPKKLELSNTGQAPLVPTKQLFERFQKNVQSDRSLGLGLSIVRKICDIHNFGVDYHYETGAHRISVKFSSRA